ncbi:hypothetical protein PR202_gb02716 [Eleusine coracana subsp. coracana]|uniref:Uncharacterized protein n=1 Tax=Eleusine coracana subsp. coracana TaxID=191504 RepID=A0AAV5DZR9_ELECO|nr:hypothetical protein PR202_gb02716 [Eleusine coracana subsp. coracana]
MQTIQLDTMPGLYGTIPSLSKLSHLELLDITSTSITGPLPEFWVNTNLSALTITDSKLTGPIPNLRYIDLSGNMLTAHWIHTSWIAPRKLSLTGNPSFLFDAAKPMTKIDLSWNVLGFDMTKVRFPYHLTYLDLSHDKSQVSFLTAKLRHFNVSYNELCPEGHGIHHGANSYDHNKCLCGTPLVPCKKRQ